MPLAIFILIMLCASILTISNDQLFMYRFSLSAVSRFQQVEGLSKSRCQISSMFGISTTSVLVPMIRHGQMVSPCKDQVLHCSTRILFMLMLVQNLPSWKQNQQTMNFHLWLIADPAYWYLVPTWPTVSTNLTYRIWQCAYACINLVTVIKSNDLLMKFRQKKPPI